MSEWLRFGWACLAYAARGRLSYPAGHLTPTSHVIDHAFAGVGVAAASDPAVDDYILSRLQDAGIKNVRLDFTYGDYDGPAGRLLEALHAASIRIVLHLVQPCAQAECMATDAASRERWQNFVAETLARYGHLIEMVEIGSTINRQRWAGYSLPGFLQMWDIAWREVRKTTLPLAGPSITDFEPPWNIGILSLLRARNQLPDLHTDNLFAERCGEPECYDHKVFGHTLARLIRFNLVKKARLLQRIGQDFSVPRLFSPAAFWTLPRIERRLPDAEEKQADYLARYMLLCATSGALDRAWWGPLICHREGLVDEGARAYPALERITHYAEVSGSVPDFRARPALQSMGGFVRKIPGSRYEGRQNQSASLHVHAFRDNNQLIHAVWTGDGQLAALSDIYAADDLASARFFTRNGDPLSEPPSLAGESPTYLAWPASCQIVLRREADVLPNVTAHWHIQGKHHFHFKEAGWQGVVLAEDTQQLHTLLQAIHPAHLESPAPGQILRKARNLIWAIDDPRTPGARLVVKKPLKMHFHKRILDRFKPSKGLRSWTGTAELLRRGIGAATPIAYFERCDESKLIENFYICEYTAAECSVRDLFAKYAKGGDTHFGLHDELVYDQLSSYLLKMHRNGIVFRDLSGGNILIRKTDDGQLRFELIDTGRLRSYPQSLSFRKRISDLVRVCNKLHWEGRERFLSMYFRKCGKELRFTQKIHFMIYDAKVSLKRKLKQFNKKIRSR